MNRKTAALFAAAVLTAGLATAAGPPETVHVTYHVQPGKLEEFLGVLKQHHPACLKLGLVLAEPHMILSGKEDGGNPVVIEILTWIDSDAPDSVPGHQPAVKKIWTGSTPSLKDAAKSPAQLDAIVQKLRSAKSGFRV